MSDDTDTTEDNGRKRTISIKLDQSTVTSIVALLSALGFGVYNQVDTVDIDHTRAGVTLQVNDAVQQSSEQTRKLARLVKRQANEINLLHETVEWLAGSLNEVGRRHPSSLRKIKVNAPEHIGEDFGFVADEDLLDSGGVGVGYGAGISDYSLEDILDEPPKAIEFPALNRIKSAIESRRGQ